MICLYIYFYSFVIVTLTYRPQLCDKLIATSAKLVEYKPMFSVFKM